MNTCEKKNTHVMRHELGLLAGPLIEWLKANCHPHCHIVIDQTAAELVEGILAWQPPQKGSSDE